MSYIGNNLQVAYPSYANIDDISGSFDGVTTSFPLTVGGVAPVPAPLSSNQCLISVGGVVQRPDDSGSEGFLLSGGNIVFSAAPTGGDDFFGVILAGADYVNVGVNFPSGTASTPSITFDTDLDTGLFNSGANELAISTAGTSRLVVDSGGNVNIDAGGAYYDASTNRVGIGTTSPSSELHVVKTGASDEPTLRIQSENSSIYLRTAGSSGSFPTGGGGNDGELVYAGGDFRVGIGGSSDKNVIFFNGNTYQERARIDSSGRLLVGTSSGSGNPLLKVQGNVANSNAGAICVLARGNNPAVAGNALGTISFQQGTDEYEGASIIAESDAAWTAGSSYPSRLVFLTTANGVSSPTERMRITSNGNIYIIEGDTYAANYNGGASGGFRWRATTTQAGTQMEGYATGTTTSRHILFSNPNGVVGAITTAASATTYTTSSDYRLKENVTAVTDGITRLQQLKPSRFNFIADPDTVVDGFLAHEAQAVVPECVTGTKDEVDDDGNPVYQGIDQSKLVPLLTAALQEAIAKIEALEGMVAVNNITIDEQQHQLSTLEARLTALESA